MRRDVQARPGPARPSQGLEPAVWKVIGVVLLGPFMTQLDSTVVNVSLPTLQEQLHCSIGAAQWVISGYLLALALMLPLNGWLVSRLGAKRLYLVSFSAFTLASALCGAAGTMGQLVCARLAQGLAGGLLVPLAQMMMARVAGKHLARVMGYAAAPILLAPILGPVVAGAILQHATWPWLFLLNVPVGSVAVVLAALLLPKDEANPQGRPLDLPGFFLVSPGLACSLYGLENIARAKGLLWLAGGLALLAVFIVHARKNRSRALLDLGLFSNPTFRTASLTQFFSNGVLYAGQMLIPFYLVRGCGFTAAHAGWMLAFMGLGMMCVYPVMGFLTDRFGCRGVSVAGIALNTLGTLPFLWMLHSSFSTVLLAVSMFARGAGQGATGVPALSAAYAAVPREKLAFATTAVNIVQRLGGPVATTAMAILLSGSALQASGAASRGFAFGFAGLIALQLVVLGAACRLPLQIHAAKR